ncbi:nuclear transport factor 2 family protein [Nocardia sp. NPDC049220]|uniref:nuclear transport factor 2 family protein n=1 Tax=Nocardia sp. NPDC049220 TaxID=3155273 RepID=UPI003403B269
MTTQIRDVVEQYALLAGPGRTEDIVTLYGPDAVAADPIGTPANRGHDAIRGCYTAIAALDQETELRCVVVRAADNHAAFPFTLVTEVDGQRVALSPIDVMEFDEEDRITEMRAYWSQADRRVELE